LNNDRAVPAILVLGGGSYLSIAIIKALFSCEKPEKVNSDAKARVNIFFVITGRLKAVILYYSSKDLCFEQPVEDNFN